MRPLWVVRLEEYQRKNGVSDYAMDKAINRPGTNLINKAKRRALSGGGVNLKTLFLLARVMHCSPRGLVEQTVPKEIQ